MALITRQVVKENMNRCCRSTFKLCVFSCLQPKPSNLFLRQTGYRSMRLSTSATIAPYAKAKRQTIVSGYLREKKKS